MELADDLYYDFIVDKMVGNLFEELFLLAFIEVSHFELNFG